MNVKKTFLLSFCRVGDSVDVNSKFLLGEKPILPVKSLRYNGFHIDSNLSWKHHSNIISAKIARGVGILRRLKHILPERTLRTTYFAIIYPYISYGCLVWSINFYVNYKRVQILQNKAARIIGKYVKSVKDTSARFKFLRLLNIGQIRDYRTAGFGFNYVHNLVPETFNEFYCLRSSVHEHDTRIWDD